MTARYSDCKVETSPDEISWYVKPGGLLFNYCKQDESTWKQGLVAGCLAKIVLGGTGRLPHGTEVDRTRSSPQIDDVPVAVTEGTDDDHDKIDQRPNTEPAERQELQDAGADLAHIKTMHAKEAQEKTQQCGRQDALL